MKAARLLTALVLMMALSSFAYGGWVHYPNSKTTKWTDDPMPATCWVRDYYLNTVWTASKLFIYEDTPRYYNYAAAADTVDLAYTGFWQQDASGIYWPRTDLAGAWGDSESKVNLLWIDVEWQIDTNSILWAK